MRFVSRSEWGARASRNRSSISSNVYGVTIHWNGPSLGEHDHSKCDSIVRSFQDYHMDSHGWSDIGYNALTCRHGYVFEGRGLGIRGAHAGSSGIGGNSHWYGLQGMIGQGDEITPELLEGLGDGIAWFRRNGAGDRLNGHRDHHATSCPGDRLYRWAQDGRADAATEIEGYNWPDGTLLQNGDEGSYVELLQQGLMELGYALPEYGADGAYGTETQKAVRSYQADAGLSVDGIAGPNTLGSLEEELKYHWPAGTTLSAGDEGRAVKILQKALLELGYKLPEYGADGAYGDETAGAVRHFQRDHGLSVDGIAGPNTLGAIEKKMA